MANQTYNSAILGEPGWLAGRGFDAFFIFGTTALALGGGLVGVVFPALLMPVMMLNIWVLGYHHVIATYTRLCFDRDSHARSWTLIYLLLPAVLAFSIFLLKTLGAWALMSLYLYAQWFHYARQSWGISRAYERKAPQGCAAGRSWQTQAAFYGVPLLGILYWSYRAPETFFGVELKVIPVSHDFFMLAAIVCVAFFLLWLVRLYRERKSGVMPPAYTYFMLSHFAVFAVGYLAMPTLDSAWLTVSIWHNTQYLLFVWLFNNRRFAGGLDGRARLLSFISQRRNIPLYFAVTLTLAFLVYGMMEYARGSALIAMPLIVAYQTLNFHHYIVDAVIWRSSWIKKSRQAV